MVETVATGVLQNGFPSLAKRKSLPCPLPTFQVETVAFLEFSVTEWSRMTVGNVKRPKLQKMGGREPITATIHGEMLTLDIATLVLFEYTEFLHIFAGLARQISQQTNSFVDVDLMGWKELAIVVGIIFLLFFL